MIALPPPFTCPAPRITDGDTIRCDNTRVRIARIDAPELRGHCRRGRHCAPGDGYASKAAVTSLIAGRTLRCIPVSASPRSGSAYDRYGRIVARCSVNGTDVGGYMVRHGWAERWPHR